MKEFTLSEAFVLPSRGKVYDTPVATEVQLRSMTTRHEMQRLAVSEAPYRNLCQVLDDCIVNDLGISSYDLCLGDYQYLIYKLRSVTYGPEIKLTTTCPICRTSEDIVISLNDFEVRTYSDEIEKYKEVSLPVSGSLVKLRMQTPRILDKITLDIKDIKKRHVGLTEDLTLVYNIMSSISEVDGERLNPVELENWVKQLPMKDTNIIMNNSRKLNDFIGVDSDILMTCSLCLKEYTSKFSITPEFFRPTDIN